MRAARCRPGWRSRGRCRLSDQSQRRFGFGVSVRVGVHWGLVYLDAAQGDFSGLAANVATGISGLHHRAQLLSQMRLRR